MPSPKPKYEDGVPPTHCRVRCCNEEGQEWPGQIAPFPYARSTKKTKGIVKRKPVFAYDPEFCYKSLEAVFRGIGGGTDYERLSDETQQQWCEVLDVCDGEPVDYNECENYIGHLLELCNRITWECTGRSFMDWGIHDAVAVELGGAWRHFVRRIWMREPEWENLVKYLSDPNNEWSVEEDYYLIDPSASVQHSIGSLLAVPLQVWGYLLKAAWDADPLSKQRQPRYVF